MRFGHAFQRTPHPPLDMDDWLRYWMRGDFESLEQTDKSNSDINVKRNRRAGQARIFKKRARFISSIHSGIDRTGLEGNSWRALVGIHAGFRA